MTFTDRTMRLNKELLLFGIIFFLLVACCSVYLFFIKKTPEGFQTTSIPITVYVNGRDSASSSAAYTISALPSDTVASVKTKLQEITRLLPDQQILNYLSATTTIPLVNMSATLASYGLTAGKAATLSLTTCQFNPLTSKYDDYYKSSYDNFTQNEQNVSYAAQAAATAANPVYSSPDIFIPTFGGLTAVDPNNIPWDADNQYADPNSTVWGVCSQSASLSIFSKVFNQNVSPVYNPDSGRVDFLGLDLGGADIAGEHITAQQQEQAIMLGGMLVLLPAIGVVGTLGAKKISNLKVSKAVVKSVSGNLSRLKASLGKSKLVILAKKLASKIGTTITARLGLSVAMARAGSIMATITPGTQWLAPILEWLMFLCMILSGLVPAILDGLTSDTRFCPEGFSPMRQIISDNASAIIGFIPIIGDIISTFQPYTCFKKSDSNSSKGGLVVLAEPVPEPMYYNDITLSAYYHNRCPLTDSGVYDSPIPNCPPVPGKPYYPPMDLADVADPWVDFSDKSVTDKMTQFYYDASIRKPNSNGDGTITYEFITKIYSVCASSAYSCDILCAISSATYDPFTGCSYNIEPAYSDDKKSNMHDRRFYFYTTDKTTKQYNSAGKLIGKGVFLISGCTNQDGTAPDAYSGFALPKTYIVNVTTPPPASSNKNIALNSAVGIAENASMVAGVAGGVGSVAGYNLQFGETAASQKYPTVYAMGANGKPLTDTSGNRLRVISEDYYDILIGPDISGNIGAPTTVNKCGKVSLSTAQCVSVEYLQNMINTYHSQNPTKHLKTITKMEARAINAPSNKDFLGNPLLASVCYYEGTVSTYDPSTNLESSSAPITLALNNATNTAVYPWACVYLPTEFDSNPSKYLPMQYVALKPGTVISPSLGPNDYRPIPVPTYPLSKSMVVPQPIPDGAPSNKAQVDVLVAAFNIAHNDRKIVRVMRTWMPTINKARIDMEVEMLRNYVGQTKSVVEKETVAIYMDITKPVPYPYASDGSATVNSGTFIQPNTPTPINDLSGGDLTATTFIGGITTAINNLLAQFNITTISKTVLSSSQAAKTTSDTLLEQVYINQSLAAPCAASKCTDPAILNAIMDKYNADNAAPAGKMFGVKVQSMASVLKAGVSSPTTCDVLFNNLVNTYSSVVEDPVSSVNIARSMRFTLINTPANSCTFTIGTYFDVSSSAIGIRSDATALPSPYIQNTCQVNCRAPPLLASIKSKIEGKNTAQAASALKTVTQSFSPTSNTCQYKITKDYTTYGVITKTTAAATSYLNASVTFDSTCNPTINTVTEIFPTTLDIQTDTTTGKQIAYQNGVPISMPVLFSYDPSTKSSRVNTTVSSF